MPEIRTRKVARPAQAMAVPFAARSGVAAPDGAGIRAVAVAEQEAEEREEDNRRLLAHIAGDAREGDDVADDAGEDAEGKRAEVGLSPGTKCKGTHETSAPVSMVRERGAPFDKI